MRERIQTQQNIFCKLTKNMEKGNRELSLIDSGPQGAGATENSLAKKRVLL
jgi:hypothetical protein